MRLLTTIVDVSTMDIILLLLWIISLLVIIFAIIIFYRVVKPAAKKIVDNDNLSLRQSMQYEKAIDKIILNLRIELNAADIFIGRFHNGGSFNNHVKMKKFSITYEKAASAVKELVMRRFYDKFCSHWPDLFDQLLVLREFTFADIKNCNDLNFKVDMEYYNFMASYVFLISQNDIGCSAEAFIAINFQVRKVLSEEERALVHEEIPKILSNMNLTSFKMDDIKKFRVFK